MHMKSDQQRRNQVPSRRNASLHSLILLSHLLFATTTFRDHLLPSASPQHRAIRKNAPSPGMMLIVLLSEAPIPVLSSRPWLVNRLNCLHFEMGVTVTPEGLLLTRVYTCSAISSAAGTICSSIVSNMFGQMPFYLTKACSPRRHELSKSSLQILEVSDANSICDWLMTTARP